MDGNQIFWEDDHKTLRVILTGRIDTVKAKELEAQVENALEGLSNASCLVDAGKLGYIASAGIRVLMELAKRCKEVKIFDVTRDIYDIFSMTGVTNLVTVERRIRSIQPPSPGTLLRKDRDGDVYRGTDELTVKLFPPEVTQEEALRKWELSRLAVSQGIPTPIAFEVVSCKDAYGMIYENIHGQTLAELYEEQPDTVMGEIRRLAALIRELHHCHIAEGVLCDMDERIRQELKHNDSLSEKEKQGLLTLMESLRRKDAFLYGNLRLQNVLLQDNKLVLLDMTRCGRGSPILDLQIAASCMCTDGHAGVWNAFFSAYTEKVDPLAREKMQKILNPGLKIWWK